MVAGIFARVAAEDKGALLTIFRLIQRVFFGAHEWWLLPWPRLLLIKVKPLS